MPRILSKATTAATTEAALNGTAYAEQTTGAQRSVKSASAADTAAGTGAQQAKVTYFTLAADGTVTGPFTETVTLNGITAVATVATNIALVDKVEVVRAGSGGASAGVVSLYTDNAGAGSVICSIVAGEAQTFLGHHYVPSGKRVVFTDLTMTNTGATVASLSVRVLQYGVTGGIESVLSHSFGVKGQYGSVTTAFPENSMPIVQGPARIRVYVTANDVGSQVTRAELGIFEQATY